MLRCPYPRWSYICNFRLTGLHKITNLFWIKEAIRKEVTFDFREMWVYANSIFRCLFHISIQEILFPFNTTHLIKFYRIAILRTVIFASIDEKNSNYRKIPPNLFVVNSPSFQGALVKQYHSFLEAPGIEEKNSEENVCSVQIHFTAPEDLTIDSAYFPTAPSLFQYL